MLGRLPVVWLTSRFANVPFVNVLVVPLKRETSASHVYASFSQPEYKVVRYASVYLVLSATDQTKAVRELTQHVTETTSEVAEQDFGETTRRQNDRKPLGRYSFLN